MFYSIQKLQEKTLGIMQEEHAQLRTVLRALEARLNAVEAVSESGESRTTGADPLPTPSSASLLQGTTVAEAAEMLRSGGTLNKLQLRPDPAETLRRDRRGEAAGLPDINL